MVLDLRAGRNDRTQVPDGVEITTLADRPDLLHAAWVARGAGYTALHTLNDETNLSMRGINKRLGYEPTPGLVMVRGPLAGVTAAP